MDTSRYDLLSEAAVSMMKLKKYDKAIDDYNQKIARNKAVPGDYFYLGLAYYNTKNWGKADSTLKYLSTLVPDQLQAYVWRARALVNIDTTCKLGLAKPTYEMVVDKAKSDTVKNYKELMESYSYLAYYYLVQYTDTKDQQLGKNHRSRF